ncbi:hypothetical protein Tco_0201081 [Tanacetum coccineum]
MKFLDYHVDEDEVPKEEEFEEEEPQEEEDDMEVDIEEDENEPELTYPYEEVGESSTNPFLGEDGDGLLSGLIRRDVNSLFGQMASLSRRLCGREMAHALVKKNEKAKDEYYGKLIADLGNEMRFSVEEGAAAMENLVRKLGNAEERAECKKLKKELEDARSSNTLLSMQKERAERNIIKPPKSAPLTQAAVRRMIKESVDAAIAAERARHANAGNDARGSGLVRGQDATPVVRECTFAGFMKCNPTIFRGTEGAVVTTVT